MRAPPPPPASPRLVMTRARHGLRNMPSLSFCHAWLDYGTKWSRGSWNVCLSGKWIRVYSVHLLAIRFTSRRCPFASLCGYIREVAPLSVYTTQSIHYLFIPEHYAAWGNKVFGERSARLLKSSSSRTPTRTTYSPTRTSSPRSTTSSTTCLSLTTTPMAVLRPHRPQHRMSSWSSLLCFSFSD
jgi:hypothetical protein